MRRPLRRRWIAVAASTVAFGVPLAGQRTHGIPFTLHREHLVLVDGAIGRLEGLVLLLDTGSGRTIVAAEVCASLGLTVRPTHLLSMGQIVHAAETEVPALSAGGFETGPHPVVATDLTATAASLGLPRLDGIIGVDILRRRSFAIDFSRRRLEFGPLLALPHRVPLHPAPIFLTVTATVNGQPARLSVDTGASHLVLFKAPVGSRPLGHGQAARMAGEADVQLVRVDSLRVGTWLSRDIVALLPGEAAGRRSDTDGLLSLAALGAGYVQFDIERHELSWRP